MNPAVHEHWHWLAQGGYVAFGATLAAGVIGLPVPIEALLMAAGYLAHQGQFNLGLTLAVACLATAAGATVNYLIGRALGARAVVRLAQRFHLASQVEAVHRWFQRSGKWSLFVAHFLPGFRHVAPLVAGTAQTDWAVFAPYSYGGGAVWAAGFVLIGFYLGREWRAVLPEIQRHRWIAAGVAAALLGLVALAWWWYRRRRGTADLEGERLASRSGPTPC